MLPGGTVCCMQRCRGGHCPPAVVSRQMAFPGNRPSHRAVNSFDADLAGEHAGVAGFIVYNELAVLVHINGRARAAVIGDAAAQIDTPRLVALAVGGKALGLVGIQRTVKTEIRHILGQPLGVCVHIDRLSGTEVAHSKPAPDTFLLAAEKLHLDPHICLVLEDSFNGVRAGRAAGCVTVMVPDLMQPTEEITKLYDRKCSDLLEVRDLLIEGRL